MKILSSLLFLTLFSAVHANNYKVDAAGMHAAIQFKISHLGYSWIIGRFDRFDGEFSYDAKEPEASSVSITVDTTSINTNHTERDKHLRNDDFLDVERYPEATFKSTSFKMLDESKGELKGILNLHGTDKEITLEITKIGEGKDPWGGYRAGFEGVTQITMADFGIEKFKGKASGSLELYIVLEGKKIK